MTEVDDGVVRGYFEFYQDRQVVGWAFDPNNPNDVVKIEFFVDNQLVETIRADLHRDDLFKAGLGTGNHGFCVGVPAKFFDGAPHTVLLRVAGTEINLTNTPKAVIFGLAVVAASPVTMLQRRQGGSFSPAMSLVMPTFNRSATMERVVRALARCKSWDDVELIIVNDGSRDDTSTRLALLRDEFANMSVTTIENSGPARARNIAASIAKSPLLLFIGDDVEPVDENFLAAHLLAHQSFPDQGVAVLGKITWPVSTDMQVNFVMQHIQGDGQQQFGFKFMEPYKWYDWHLFYSSNVSIKRNIVQDWGVDGFDEGFSLAAFEDAELGLRLSHQQAARNGAFRLLYVPAATLVHHHPHTVTSFLHRQMACGQMARRFFDKHPQVAADIGIAEINQRLAEKAGPATLPVDHYFSIFEGIKSWVLLVEQSGALGSQNWHGDLLKAVFQLAYSEGYLRTVQKADANVGAAARFILDRLTADFSQAMLREALGTMINARIL